MGYCFSENNSQLTHPSWRKPPTAKASVVKDNDSELRNKPLKSLKTTRKWRPRELGTAGKKKLHKSALKPLE
jgi:hypothetical protein